jgi:hypothetical protein
MFGSRVVTLLIGRYVGSGEKIGKGSEGTSSHFMYLLVVRAP